MSIDDADTVRAWFEEQIAIAPTHHDLMVEGTSIHYRSWGTPGGPRIVLVHGGAANGGWWDHLAPGMIPLGQVHAVDLGGQGRSDWTIDYSLERWAHELTALIDQVSTPDEPTVLVGHSRGGFIALMASEQTRADVVGIVLIESAFDVDPAPVPSAGMSAQQPNATPPPTRAQMVARFQPHPRDVSSLDYIVAHIAEQSVVEADGRWRWQFDRTFLGRVNAMRTEHLHPTSAKVLQVRSAHGLLRAETAEAARTALNPASRIVTIEGSGHHIMLQKPRELATLLNSTLESWLLSTTPGRADQM